MKLVGLLACLGFVGCAGASTAPVAALTAASVAAPPASPAAASAKPAGGEPAEDAQPAAKADDAAVDAEPEPLLKIELTPASELRNNTRAKLEAALKSTKRLTTPAAVTSALTSSLGKPTWVENETRRIWAANDARGCARLVLEEDGTVNFESMRSTESKAISRTARQSLCTGEIEPIDRF